MALEIDLCGKRALVTGASDGVGAGVARVLARAGCRVTGSGRVAPDHPRAVELLQSLRAEGREATYLCAFLASPLSGFITGNTILIDGGRSALMQD